MNLSPGKYTLMIKASNNAGIWETSYSSMLINILPAWWQTQWFKILVIFSIIAIVFILNKIVIKRDQIKRAFEFEKKRLEEQKELDEKQLRFFTNISHEIRTPLSLILSPVDELIKNKGTNNNLTLIQKKRC